MKYVASLPTVLLCCFYLLFTGAATAVTLEIKQPLNTGQELKVQQDSAVIVVSGETFAYTFSRQNGLITSVRVLDREITDGTPIPDLVVAEHLDRNASPYLASRETQASVSVTNAGPSRVVITAEGAYTGEHGARFPLRYALSYDIAIDGVALVSVRNSAVGDCGFRWLALSGGAVKSEYAKFINWMQEQSGSQSTRYLFRPLSEVKEEKVLGGTWLPWIWLGDQDRGLEVTTWDVGAQTYNRIDSTRRQDQNEVFTVRRASSGVRWENWLVNRTFVYARKGWHRGGEFALAVTPSKKFDPYYSMVKGAHLGPHQHEQTLKLPGESQIRTLAQNGFNLVVGMANWRSGEYVPLNDADLRRTIELCHKYGMKIIPYITLVDLSHATEAFRDHGEEWAIEPTTEYSKSGSRIFRRDPHGEAAYRNDPEQETTLMCPGAAGWREHWKKQVDRFLREYDFDGLYIDFWYGRMVCENTRHGCGGRYRKHTVLGSRDMLTYAYNRIKAKDPRAILKANTNTLATALITSLAELRLVGESIDMTTLDSDSRQWLYSSYRLGEPTEFLWDRTRWDPARKNGFAALVNFLPQVYDRPPFEPRKTFDDFDVFRSFEAEKGRWYLGIGGHGRLTATPSGVSVNLVEREAARLATVINPAEAPVTASIPVKRGTLAYEPLAERLLDTAGGAVTVEIAPGGYRHMILMESPERPYLLAALGARRPLPQQWDGQARRLRVSAEGVEGARIRYAVYSAERPKELVGARGARVPFEWAAETHLVRFETSHSPAEVFELRF